MHPIPKNIDGWVSGCGEESYHTLYLVSIHNEALLWSPGEGDKFNSTSAT
jgi:hypothetical protein